MTFDACPTRSGGGWDEEIVLFLKTSRTPATFFLSGKWMQSEPAKARELAQEALFELGNHSFSHPHLTAMVDPDIRKELEATERLLAALGAGRAPLFRPPFGEWDTRLVGVAAQLGLTTIQYDLASGDPDPGIDARELADYVVRQAKGGSVIVFHVNGRGWHTAEALPEIVSGLRRRGFTLVRVSDLLAGSDRAASRNRE